MMCVTAVGNSTGCLLSLLTLRYGSGAEKLVTDVLHVEEDETFVDRVQVDGDVSLFVDDGVPDVEVPAM